MVTETKIITIPMSSSGHCPKQLSAELLGQKKNYQIPTWLQEAGELGTELEGAIKRKLRREGYIIDDTEEECQICKSRFGTGRRGLHVEIVNAKDGLALVGHLDGKIRKANPDFKTALECKTMSTKEFKRWLDGGFKEFSNYADQLTCYFQASQLQNALYCVMNRNSGHTERYIINERPSSFPDIYSRLLYVIECVNKGELAYAEYKMSSIQCQYCWMSKVCVPEIRKEISPVATEDFGISLTRRAEIMKSIEELKKQKEEEELKIKEFLFNLGADKARYKIWSVTWNKELTRVTYPVRNLLQAGVTKYQLDAARQVSEPFERIDIRKTGGNPEDEND